MSTDLHDQRQRLNIALTELLASTVQIEALQYADLPVGTQSFADFFERSAICIEQVCAMQEEIVRLWQNQTEKGTQE